MTDTTPEELCNKQAQAGTRRLFRQIMFDHPDIVQELTLHHQELSALALVARGEDTSRKVAEALEISTQHALGVLYRLEQKGYIARKPKVHSTGGNYMIWEVSL